jgi:hypothetical protein
MPLSLSLMVFCGVPAAKHAPFAPGVFKVVVTTLMLLACGERRSPDLETRQRNSFNQPLHRFDDACLDGGSANGVVLATLQSISDFRRITGQAGLQVGGLCTPF